MLLLLRTKNCMVTYQVTYEVPPHLIQIDLVQMRPKGRADRLVHEEAHLKSLYSIQTILERVDFTAADILL